MTTSEDRKRRLTHLLLAGVMGCAVIGFFVGLDYGVPKADRDEFQEEFREESHFKVGTVGPAVSYDDLGKRGPSAYGGAGYTVSDIGGVKGIPSEEIEIDPSAKPHSLVKRASLRAYNGAPPTIPHSTDGMNDLACTSCHEQGVQVGDVQVPKIPHRHYTNCQQCHVAESDLFELEFVVLSAFDGKPAPMGGDRAWLGAPPVIPHSTWMRENCLSCHGPSGRAGLRTSHPNRTNCMQCHARDAVLDPFEPTVGRPW